MLSAHLVRGPSSGWAGFPPSSSRRRALGSAAGPVPEFLYPPLQARGWRHSRLADDPKIHLRSGSCSSWNSGLLSAPVLSTCKSGSTSSLNSQMAPSPAASVLPCRAARLCSPPKPPPSPISSAVTESQNPFLLSCYQHHVSPAGRDGPRRAPPAPVLSDAYGLVSAQHEVLLSHRLDPPPPSQSPGALSASESCPRLGRASTLCFPLSRLIGTATLGLPAFCLLVTTGCLPGSLPILLPELEHPSSGESQGHPGCPPVTSHLTI